MKKLLTAIMILTLVFAFTACGNKESAPMETQSAEAEIAGEEGQNPVMNFVGDYECDRAYITIEADGKDGARATVTWGGGADTTTEWTMSGKFDEKTLTFEYSDCVKKGLTYGEGGEVENEDVAYMDGKGSMTFKDGDPITLTWQDDQENVADGMTFEFVGLDN